MGCRQGCPISLLLHNLVAEIMGCKIRQNNDIRGIVIARDEEKGAQYADDLSLLDSRCTKHKCSFGRNRQVQTFFWIFLD